MPFVFNCRSCRYKYMREQRTAVCRFDVPPSTVLTKEREEARGEEIMSTACVFNCLLSWHLCEVSQLSTLPGTIISPDLMWLAECDQKHSHTADMCTCSPGGTEQQDTHCPQGRREEGSEACWSPSTATVDLPVIPPKPPKQKAVAVISVHFFGSLFFNRNEPALFTTLNSWACFWHTDTSHKLFKQLQTPLLCILNTAFQRYIHIFFQ